MVEILISIVDTNRCTHDVSVSSPDRSTRAWQSIFGWVIGGKMHSFSDNTNCLKLTSQIPFSNIFGSRKKLQFFYPFTPKRTNMLWNCFVIQLFISVEGILYSFPKRNLPCLWVNLAVLP